MKNILTSNELYLALRVIKDNLITGICQAAYEVLKDDKAKSFLALCEARFEIYKLKYFIYDEDADYSIEVYPLADGSYYPIEGSWGGFAHCSHYLPVRFISHDARIRFLEDWIDEVLLETALSNMLTTVSKLKEER